MKNIFIVVFAIAVVSSCAQKNVELEDGVSFIYLEKGKGQEVDSLKTVTTNVNLIVNQDTVWTTYGTDPFEFVYKGPIPMIKGFDMVLAELKGGDRIVATIPPEMGYGSRAQGATIPANSTLIFDIAVLSVE